MSSDGTLKTTSPATRSGSRLVARIVSRGAERSSRSASAAVSASTCSQLSSTSSSIRGGEEAGHGVAEILRREGADVERGRHRLGHEPRVGQCAELDERGTRLERALGAAGQLEREARLARYRPSPSA